MSSPGAVLRFPTLTPCPQCRRRLCGPVRCTLSGIKHEVFRALPECVYRTGQKCAPGCERRGLCLDAA